MTAAIPVAESSPTAKAGPHDSHGGPDSIRSATTPRTRPTPGARRSAHEHTCRPRSGASLRARPGEDPPAGGPDARAARAGAIAAYRAGARAAARISEDQHLGGPPVQTGHDPDWWARKPSDLTREPVQRDGTTMHRPITTTTAIRTTRNQTGPGRSASPAPGRTTLPRAGRPAAAARRAVDSNHAKTPIATATPTVFGNCRRAGPQTKLPGQCRISPPGTARRSSPKAIESWVKARTAKPISGHCPRRVPRPHGPSRPQAVGTAAAERAARRCAPTPSAIRACPPSPRRPRWAGTRSGPTWKSPSTMGRRPPWRRSAPGRPGSRSSAP